MKYLIRYKETKQGKWSSISVDSLSDLIDMIIKLSNGNDEVHLEVYKLTFITGYSKKEEHG